MVGSNQLNSFQEKKSSNSNSHEGTAIDSMATFQNVFVGTGKFGEADEAFIDIESNLI